MIELSDSNEEEVRGVREGVRYEKGEMMLLIGCHTFCCWGARGWGVLKVSTKFSLNSFFYYVLHFFLMLSGHTEV